MSIYNKIHILDTYFICLLVSRMKYVNSNDNDLPYLK